MKLNLEGDSQRRKDIKDRNNRNNKIIVEVSKACKKLGGYADIGDGYVAVDTRVYEVKLR